MITQDLKIAIINMYTDFKNKVILKEQMKYIEMEMKKWPKWKV